MLPVVVTEMMQPESSCQPAWKSRLNVWQERINRPLPLVVEGVVSRMEGLTLEASGCRAAIGERCTILNGEDSVIEAEVIGFRNNCLLLMPTDHTSGIVPGARVIPATTVADVGVGPDLLGRVLDSSGRPLDDKGTLKVNKRIPINALPINPLHRRLVREPLDVGIRCINALLTIGKGQRIGLFAGSGVGKSVLLGMMTRYTSAEVIVLGLIGERGREVREFIENILGPEGMRRAVVIVSPSDDPPLKRLHAASLATSVAEYFRDCGKDVLLLMDSLTRYAQAQREIALSAGEPPATRGYPPSVFSRIPQLVERVGAIEGHPGSITGIYTVLVEGDDKDDPIVDTVRATLDGHIFLNRQLAEAGIFPAIDVCGSISRVYNELADPALMTLSRRFRGIYSHYREQQDMINIGAYRKGSHAQTDEAIAMFPGLLEFIRQDIDSRYTLADSRQQLHTCLASG
jgi:flagellum-specific ATP synthase